MAKPTKQSKEDAAQEKREEREEEEREMRAEEEREASAKPAKTATAVTRDPKATTLQETPEPGPIDPDWEKPEVAELSERDQITKATPRPGGDSEEHGTEFPPRLSVLGYKDALPEAVSTILGKPATPEQTGPFRKKPEAV